MIYNFTTKYILGGFRVTICGDEHSFLDISKTDTLEVSLGHLHDMYERGVRDGRIQKAKEVRVKLEI